MLLLHVCDQLGKEAGISYEKVADGGEKCPILVNTDMVKVIQQFYTHPRYLDAVVERIQESLRKFRPAEEVHLVFSAHSVPVSVIDSGDPYKDQIEATVELVMQRGAWSLPYSLCYQSKVGASKWLQPSLHDVVRSGVRSDLSSFSRRSPLASLLVIPLSQYDGYLAPVS